MEPEEAEQLLMNFVEYYVKKQLQAGKILALSFHVHQQGAKYLLQSVMECHEMIAERVSGKITFED